MVCVQCGTENSEGAKYCSSCSALLFQAAPDGLPTSSALDIGESLPMPAVTTHYQSPLLESLAWAVHEFAEEEGDLEPVVETYEAYREVYEAFSQEIPALQELRYCCETFFDDDPESKYIKFLLDRAIEFYKKGESLFEGYLESLESLGDDEAFPDAEPLKEGTRAWLDCNDNICMTFELLTAQKKACDDIVEDYQERLAAGLIKPDGDAVEEGAEV